MKVIYSWEDWKIFAEIAIRSFFVGIVRPLWLIVVGLISLCHYIGCVIGAFAKREFVAAMIIMTVLVVVAVAWLATFVNERSKRVEAEMQRDSIAYILQKKMQLYEPTKDYCILNGDTLRIW